MGEGQTIRYPPLSDIGRGNAPCHSSTVEVHAQYDGLHLDFTKFHKYREKGHTKKPAVGKWFYVSLAVNLVFAICL